MSLGLEEEIYEYLVRRYPELLPTDEELDQQLSKSYMYKGDVFEDEYQKLIAHDYFKFGYRMAQKAIKEQE